MSAGMVLLVDDDEDIVDTIQIILRKEGWNVTAALDGVRGLERLRAGLRPDLILLDLMMPGLNGWQFCDALRADSQLRDIPVVVLSGSGDVMEKAASLGAVAHLRKPFELSELLETVRRHALGGEPRPAP